MITLTDSARDKILEFMNQNPVVAPYTPVLRLRVTGGGCSGYKNEMGVESADETELQKAFLVNDVYVVIDPKSALFLVGAVVDYVEGLMQSGFSIRVAGAKSTCGCGQSWN